MVNNIVNIATVVRILCIGLCIIKGFTQGCDIYEQEFQKDFFLVLNLMYLVSTTGSTCNFGKAQC